ncbi:MAG: hypothetical protein ABH951_01085 [Patescibacteria group bacterium]
MKKIKLVLSRFFDLGSDYQLGPAELFTLEAFLKENLLKEEDVAKLIEEKEFSLCSYDADEIPDGSMVYDIIDAVEIEGVLFIDVERVRKIESFDVLFFPKEIQK